MSEGGFLSEKWLEALGRRLGDSVPADAAPISLGVVVTSAPVSIAGSGESGSPGESGSATEPDSGKSGSPGESGSAPHEVRYTLRLGGGAPAELVAGTVEDAEVVLVETFEDARALAEGSVTAAELLEGGRIKLRGDANRLIAATETLAALGTALAGALGAATPAG